MNYYTSTIPFPLAEKLKEKGMPMMPCFNITQTGSFSDDGGIHFYYHPTFGACFDWLMSEKGLRIVIEPSWDFANEMITDMWDCDIVKVGAFSSQPKTTISQHDTWHEAAEKAIEKALELIKEK